jgi:hypothetical protein
MNIKQFLSAVLLLILLTGLALASTVTAQDPPPDDNLTLVVGALDVMPDGTLVVGGIALVVTDYSLLPSPLMDGDIVVVTGVLLDATTLQVISFERFDGESTPTPTPDMTLTGTPDLTLTATITVIATVTPEMTLTPMPTLTACEAQQHPVALQIAETFAVPVEEVMALHCAGNGFGNIVRAYALAEAMGDGTTAQDLIARHNSGEGWGNIMRDSDVHPSELAPGRVLRGGPHGSDDATAEANSASAGASGGNGNGNGNGNGGNGGGNGNGNGSNGNGNGGGNGNGNGNGNGGRGGRP